MNVYVPEVMDLQEKVLCSTLAVGNGGKRNMTAPPGSLTGRSRQVNMDGRACVAYQEARLAARRSAGLFRCNVSGLN